MSINLITIDEYKVYKLINSEDYDATISLLIGSVSNFIREYTGRLLLDYALKNKVEYFDATSYDIVYPKEYPILEVVELAVSTDGGVTYTTLTENTDYFVDTDADSLIANTGLTGFVSSTITHHSGRITYKGGYLETPDDLKLAAMDLVHYYRNEEHAPAKTMQGAGVDNPVVFSAGDLLPAHIRRVLDLYRVL